eukprot:TRINITY_DN6002_c0_g1_i2.p1 TRINITY_DN6002_c0_g1~~TRINITY_DN6002_c0_g1_i2.p1  ORF type:complete len:378 (-),score=95.39 TRINITY_DN6002_c0_g1_i2:357-1490(-)
MSDVIQHHQRLVEAKQVVEKRQSEFESVEKELNDLVEQLPPSSAGHIRSILSATFERNEHPEQIAGKPVSDTKDESSQPRTEPKAPVTPIKLEDTQNRPTTTEPPPPVPKVVVPQTPPDSRSPSQHSEDYVYSTPPSPTAAPQSPSWEPAPEPVDEAQPSQMEISPQKKSGVAKSDIPTSPTTAAKSPKRIETVTGQSLITNHIFRSESALKAEANSLRNSFKNKEQPEQLLELKPQYQDAHLKKPRNFIFNPADPERLATTSLDGSIKIWNFKDGELTEKGAMPSQVLRTTTWPNSAAWNTAGDHIAVVFPWPENGLKSDNKQLVVTDVTEFPKAKTRPVSNYPHTKDVLSVSWYKNSSTKIINTGKDHRVVVWNI